MSYYLLCLWSLYAIIPWFAFDSKNLLDAIQEPGQFSDLLSQLSPSKRFRCVLALILRAVMSSGSHHKELLFSLTEPLISDVVEELLSVGTFLHEDLSVSLR